MDIKMPLATDIEIHAVEGVVANLKAVEGVLKVVLFGSRVRGDFTGDSDLDILIIIDDIRRKEDVVAAFHDIELEHEIPFGPVIYTKHEYDVNLSMGSPFFKEVQKEGIILYDIIGRGKN